MTFKISPALKEDVPAILDLLYDTFKAPYILEAFPNTPVVRRWWADCLYRSLEEEDQNVQMMVMVEETPDGKRKIGAFSKWSVEQGGRERTHWSERWCVELPDEMSKELVDGYYQGVEEQQARDMGQRRHWYLEIMGTSPDCQKRGLASQILEWAVEEIDNEGVEAYLNASALGKPLYEKYGFVTQVENSLTMRGMKRSHKVEAV